MRYLLSFCCLLSCFGVFGQTLVSGNYEELQLAYNPQTKLVTGFYNSSTGLDEATGNARFTCIFYIEGKLSNNIAVIKTYYPLDTSDIIMGKMTIQAKDKISISLPEEHGGCWNVQHFADEPVSFALDHKQNWIEIRYIVTDKAYFYSTPNDSTKKNSYLVKADIIYIDAIKDGWLHCKYIGKKTSEGWIKRTDAN